MVARGGDVTAMRRPRVRLGYVLELVATAALCFGMVRAQVIAARGDVVGWSGLPPGMDASYWVRRAGGPLLAGLAIAGGVGLAVEAIRGRKPSSWGLGRWIWSIAGLTLLVNVAADGFSFGVEWLSWKAGAHRPPVSMAPSAMGIRFFHWPMYHFFDQFGLAIAAVCTTAMITRQPHDPAPDARDWAGRLFASLAVALTIAVSLLHAMGR